MCRVAEGLKEKTKTRIRVDIEEIKEEKKSVIIIIIIIMGVVDGLE